MSLSRQDWPHESVAGELDSFYGNPRGSGGSASPSWEKANLTQITSPWKMSAEEKPLTHGITIHKKCALSLSRILAAIWDHYQHDQSAIEAAHLNEFDGSFNFRANRNNPSKLSVHSYGAAIDLAAAENPNGKAWRAGSNMMPQAVVDIFKAEGWVWGGDFHSTKDPMHFQATFNALLTGKSHPIVETGTPSQSHVPARHFSNIVTTEFAGPNDRNNSAYTGRLIDGSKPGAALPYHFKGTPPDLKITDPSSGRSIICPLVDVGPWNIDDQYWLTADGRPQAETGIDMRGRKTNLAGLDLTPGGWAALGLPNVGKGHLDWEFSTKEIAMAEETAPVAHDVILDFLKGKLQAPDLSRLQGLMSLHLPTDAPSNFPLVTIEGIVGGIEKVLPIVAKFYPPLAIVLPFLPILVRLLEDIQNVKGDPHAILTAVEKHFSDISAAATQLKASFPPPTR